MAQFNLTWFNNAVILNPSVTGQRVSHRLKALGGIFSAIGYTPANDLPKTASASLSPVLANNVIYEFKVEAICTAAGLGITPNDNGLQEGLKFACLVPTLSVTTTTATITLNVANTDITKASFILHRVSDDVVVNVPALIDRLGTGISYTATGITPDTAYYWEYILHATVGGIAITSNAPTQLGASCESVETSTLPDACEPVTALTSIATEV